MSQHDWQRKPTSAPKPLTPSENRFDEHWVRVEKSSSESLKSFAIAKLTEAEATLRSTPIDKTLADHGWSNWFAKVMADSCAHYRHAIETGQFQRSWGGGGLMRQMQDDISPTTSDILTQSVATAYTALYRFSDTVVDQELS